MAAESDVAWRVLGFDVFDGPSLADHAALTVTVRLPRHAPLTLLQDPHLAARTHLKPPPPSDARHTEVDSATGATVWDSAIALANLLASHEPSLVHGRRVVELGAGCGLPGIAAARVGASRVVLTDRAELVPLLRRNAEANAASDSVDVRVLDWDDDGGLADDAPKADVVLASEVANDVHVVPKVVRTMERVIDSNAFALAAYDTTTGRDAAHQALVDELRARKWSVRNVAEEEGSAPASWRHRSTITVLRCAPPSIV